MSERVHYYIQKNVWCVQCILLAGMVGHPGRQQGTLTATSISAVSLRQSLQFHIILSSLQSADSSRSVIVVFSSRYLVFVLCPLVGVCQACLVSYASSMHSFMLFYGAFVLLPEFWCVGYHHSRYSCWSGLINGLVVKRAWLVLPWPIDRW